MRRPARSFVLPLLVLVALALAGCAGGGRSPAGNGGGSAVPDAGDGDVAGVGEAADELRIVVDAGEGSAPQTWTLSCGGAAEGSHPRAAEACTHLEGMTDPFAPLPADRMCTEQYGGPQTAHITGQWRGEPVDVELSRVDGCHISQWDSFGPVLPVPVGVDAQT